jgi:rare lipoprotein A
VLVMASVQAEATGWSMGGTQVGWASWYGMRFHGRETASGERFSVMQLTAAHRHLPLGTKVIVMNLSTNEAVEVKINDRGPFADQKRRIIDLSRAAADTIGLLTRGVGPVQVLVSEEALELQDRNDEIFYEVQVGAFVDVDQAHEFLAQFQDQYPSVHLATRDGPLGRYHRVRIGPFEVQHEAQQVLSTLIDQGYYAFLDEVAASSLLERLRMVDDREPEGIPSQSRMEQADRHEEMAFRIGPVE